MNSTTNKLYYLEGIRGVAAFIVLIAHLKNIFAPDLEVQSLHFLIRLTHSQIVGTMLNSFVYLLFAGKLSVHVFWFMSGYVLSIKLFSATGNDYLKAAVIKRYFRLAIPVLASVLLAYGLMKGGWMYNSELARVLGERYSGLNTVYNFDPDLLNAIRSGLWDSFYTGHPVNSYNSVLWTMPPELIGSFFCFALFAVFRIMPYRYFVYAGLAILAIYFGYFWLVTFILGFFLCDIDHTSNKLKPVSNYLALYFFSKWYYRAIVLLVLIFINGFGYSDYSAYAKIVVSAVFIYTVMQSKPLQNIFSTRPLKWLGRISFGLYLIHHPIICSFTCYLYLQLGYAHCWNAIISSLLTVPVVLVAAAAFTKFIDRPAIMFSSALAKVILTNRKRSDL